MTQFFLGLVISGIVGVIVAYNCYNRREIVEKRLKQNVVNLEHNLVVAKKENQLKVDQLEMELKHLKEEYKRSLGRSDILSKELETVKEQLEECRKKLAE
jgi:hypothetical protein